MKVERKELALDQFLFPGFGADRILGCGICGMTVDPTNLSLEVWRACDERDNPIPGNDALIFLGVGAAHTACRKALDDHPRLFTHVAGDPGSFPELCGPCTFRKGMACSHPDLMTNGGKGLEIHLHNPLGIVRIHGANGCYAPVRNAEFCVGRTTCGGANLEDR